MEHLVQLLNHHEILDTALLMFLVFKQFKTEANQLALMDNQLRLITILEKELQANNRLLTIIAKENGWLK